MPANAFRRLRIKSFDMKHLHNPFKPPKGFKNAPPSLYGPLDPSKHETRLLEIAPSADDTAPITCKLHVISLDSNTKPEYVALSYVWGNPEETAPIKVNGFDCKVTTNLESALRHIRKPNEAVMLWADAACINQRDVEERSLQVSMMSDIFTTAGAAIAWLGEATEDTQLAFQLITQWAAYLRTIGYKSSEPVFEPEEIEEIARFAFDVKAIQAIETLGTRAYWTRIWVLQELVLTRKMECMCGRTRYPISDLRLATSVWMKIADESERQMQTTPNYLDLCVTPLVQMLNAVRIFAPDDSLPDRGDHYPSTPELSLDLLLELQHLQATDPRDKIYGILGILSSKPGNCPEPDYKRPVEDLFCELAKDMILVKGDLRVAHYAGTKYSDRDTLTLPSWVPEWGICNPNLTLQYFVPWYRSGPLNMPPAYVRFSTDNCILYCKGLILDEIDEVYPVVLPAATEEAKRVIIDKFLQPILTQGSQSARLEELFRAISLDTFSIGVGRHKMIPYTKEYFSQAICFLTTLKNWVSNSWHVPLSEDMQDLLIRAFLPPNEDEESYERVRQLFSEHMDLDPAIDFYHFRLENSMSGKFPFRTKNNAIGAAPQEATTGDVICHLAGHNFPFILHRVAGHFVVRGECYIPDVELPEPTEELLSTMQEFEIR